ncbi:MAG TPA: sterol desaturase family protein [Pyrinomonadaceae bacterium]|jgi:sterol desaturase/sphingolipid hydroxylase (fatty acid hydroxylase superfamily)
MSTQLKISPQSFGQEKVRWLNRFTAHASNYWLGFFADPLTVVFLLVWDAAVLRGRPLMVAASFGGGILGWTLVEYCFHRWVYHRGQTLMHAGHAMHHEMPEAAIGMPWFITTGLMLSLWYIFAYLLEIPFVVSAVAGWLAGFFSYYSFHHLIHHRLNLKYGWYRRLRAHHKIHHQLPETNFGVTSRLWDNVFGTLHRRAGAAAAGRSSVAHAASRD